MNKLSIIAFCCLLCTSGLSGQNSFWEQVPGPPGGTVDVFPTTKTDTIYGKAGINLYRSIDNGVTWLPFTVGFAGSPVSYAVDIGSKGTFFYKAGDYPYFRLYASASEGADWHMLRDSISNQYLIKETASGSLIEVERPGAGPTMTVSRSVDGGLNWTTVLQHNIYDDGSGAYPGVISAILDFPNGTIVLKSGRLLYRSDDDGQSWSAVSDPGLNERLAVTNSGTMLLYGNSGYYHRSTDGGMTWDSLSLSGQPSNPQKINSLLTLPSGQILCSDTAGNELFHSGDDGLSWTQQAADRHVDLLFYLPGGDILGKDSLLYRSSDNGIHWNLSNAGVSENTVQSISFSNANAIFVTTDDGLWRSLDGNTWTQVLTGTFTYQHKQSIAVGEAQHLLADPGGYWNNKILWSEDWGDSFTDITPQNTSPIWFPFVALSPGDSVFFTNGEEGILRSADHGISWEYVINDNTYATNMVFHPSGRYFVLFETYNKPPYYSDDFGKTWQPVPNFPGSFQPATLTIGPGGVLYVRDFEYGLLARSADNGASWQVSDIPVSYNFTHLPLLEDAAGHFWSGDSDGNMVLSADQGITWQTQPAISSVYLTSYTLSPDQYVYLTLLGDGLYRTTAPATQGAYLRGNVRKDADADCSTPDAQQPLANWAVEAAGNYTFYTTTDSAGAYQFYVDTGTYSVTARTPQQLWWSFCDSTQTVVLDSLFGADTLDFAAIALGECPLMTVDVVIPTLRRCFDNNVYVQYCNQGGETADSAYLDLTLDPSMNFVSSDQQYSDLGNNIYRFFLGNIQSGQCGQFNLRAHLDCNAVSGQTHCVEAHAYPDTLCVPTPDWSGAQIVATATCLDTSVQFKLYNDGTAPSHPLDYIIIEDDVVLMSGQKQYNLNDSVVTDVPANGHTWRIESQQEPGHPFSVQAVAFNEGCGGFESLGFVNQFNVNTFQPSWDQTCVQNTNSYDPNDKQGFPLGFGDEHVIRPGGELEYLIRFQNTGTDTAFTIVIRDTLSPWLDPASVRPGASSHPCTWALSGQGVLRFTFSNILLPDSNINLAASQGFVSFKINQRQDVPPGAKIFNTADIYFDFNEAVTTNQTLHTVGIDYITGTYLPPVQKKQSTVSVSPNPVAEYAEFQLINGSFQRHRLIVTDAFGRTVQETELTGKQYLFQRRGLPAGTYFYRLEDAAGRWTNGGSLILR